MINPVFTSLKYFRVDDNSSLHLSNMDFFEAIQFIDDFFKGHYRKEVVPDTDNRCFSYYAVNRPDVPVAYSIPNCYSFNRFCRKVWELNEW